MLGSESHNNTLGIFTEQRNQLQTFAKQILAGQKHGLCEVRGELLGVGVTSFLQAMLDILQNAYNVGYIDWHQLAQSTSVVEGVRNQLEQFKDNDILVIDHPFDSGDLKTKAVGEWLRETRIPLVVYGTLRGIYVPDAWLQEADRLTKCIRIGPIEVDSESEERPPWTLTKVPLRLLRAYQKHRVADLERERAWLRAVQEYFDRWKEWENHMAHFWIIPPPPLQKRLEKACTQSRPLSHHIHPGITLRWPLPWLNDEQTGFHPLLAEILEFYCRQAPSGGV